MYTYAYVLFSAAFRQEDDEVEDDHDDEDDRDDEDRHRRILLFYIPS